MKTRIKDLNIEFSKNRVLENQLREREFEQNFKNIWFRLVDEEELLPLFNKTKKELAKFQLDKMRQKLMKSKQDEYETGDQGTKEFYKQFNEKREKAYIYQLENDQNQIVSTTPEILNTTFEFFSELFKEKPNYPQLAKKILKGITPIEDLQNSEDLTKLITKTELFWIIKKMATGKTPGPDGIAIEFYCKCWHIIGDDFTQVLKEIHEKGIIPD